MTPARRVVLFFVLMLVLAGCRVDARLSVALDDDGRGTVGSRVTLDAEAVQRLEGDGRTLADTIRLNDLSVAGWRVSDWSRAGDGSAAIDFEHEFAGEDELRARLGELDAGNIVRDAAIVRERGMFRSRDEVTLDIDLREVGASVSDDEELVASLQAAGVDAAALDQQLDAELRDALRVTVTVEAPDGRVTTAELTPGQEQSVVAARSDFDSNRLVMFVIAGLLLFLAALLYVSASASARRARAARADQARDGERVPLM